jgi:hypothetical protein
MVVFLIKRKPLLSWSAVPGAYGRDAFFRYAVSSSCYRRTMVIIRAENCYQYLYAYLRRFHCLTQSFTNNKNEYTIYKVAWNCFLKYAHTWTHSFEMVAQHRNHSPIIPNEKSVVWKCSEVREHDASVGLLSFICCLFLALSTRCRNAPIICAMSVCLSVGIQLVNH